MPLDLLALSAALLAGLMGSLHCVAMCGGVATSLAATAATTPVAALSGAVQLNLGRVTGYVAAGAAAGALGGTLLNIVNSRPVELALRVALGMAMMLVALRLAGVGHGTDPLRRVSTAVWNALAPSRRQVVPADTAVRRFALGMLWGWLPCGLSGNLLVLAWLQADLLHGALVMAAFGCGTLLVMIPLSWSGARYGAATRGSFRRLGAGFVFVSGALTAAGPWLARFPPLQTALMALGCRSLS